MKMRTVLEAIGTALLLFPSYRSFVLPSNIELYHHHLPVTNLIGGMLIDLLGITLLVAGILVAIQRLPPVPQRVCNTLFAGLILWRAGDVTIRALYELRYPDVRTQDMRILSVFAAVFLSIVLCFAFPQITELLARAVRLVIAASAFSALWIVPQLFHVALEPQRPESSSVFHTTVQPGKGSSQRIVWILFDELSYHQTFDHPYPGIALPNLNRFRAESVSFSRLKPVGFYTDSVIPSLFLGKQIDEIRSTPYGDLMYKNDTQSRWSEFDPNATLFGTAQKSGWNTGLVGNFIPYCRILQSVLNECFWNDIDLLIEEMGASENKSALANAAVFPAGFLTWLSSRGKPLRKDAQTNTYKDYLRHSQAMITDDRVQFIFLHFPFPHPPGKFDRMRHVLRTGGTYLDNLVLTDDTLNALLQQINGTAANDRTTVIVSSDHSWRTPIWRNSRFWSTEEQRATSGGRFDDRPVFMIHFPGQNFGIDVDSALPAMLEHDIIERMLLGKLKNSEDLETFLGRIRTSE